MKIQLLYLVSFFVMLSSWSSAQILKNTNLHLNPGGKVYDVAYLKSQNVYIIVGDFTTVNTVPRRNFAFLDGNTLSLLGADPINTIDGVIRSVAVVQSHKYVFPPSGGQYIDTVYSIYLGGSFQTINGQSKSYLARVSSTWTGQTGTASTFALDNFNLRIDAGTTTDDDGIFDMTTDLSIDNHNTQSVTLAGKFTVTTGAGAPFYTSTTDNQDLYNFARFNHVLVSNQFLTINFDFPLSSSITSLSSPPFYDVGYTYEGILLCENSPTNSTHAKVYAFGASNDQGQVLRTYTGATGFNSVGRESTVYIAPNGDTTLWVGRFENATSRHNSMNQNTAAINNFTVRNLVNYNGDLYNTVPHPSTSIASLGKTNATTQIVTSTNLANFNDTIFQKKLHCEQNRLFLSDEGLTSVGGQTRNGLAVFCLEPFDSEPFTASQSSACHGEMYTYSIDAVKFADGYRWTYSGTGAQYRITGSANAWQPLSNVHLTAANAQSIDVQFPTGSTSGTLTVAPFSVCNTSTDYQYSQSQSISITINVIPSLTLAPNYTLNCYSDTTYLVAQSSMPNVVFSWTYPTSAAPTLNDTIAVAQGLNFSDSSYYVVEVTNPISGCSRTDSTFFASDLVAAPLQLSAVTTDPVEWTCNTDSMTLFANQTGYFVQWANAASPTLFNDPFTIYTEPIGSFTIHGTQLSNGCSTQIAFGGIPINDTVAVGTLIGYSYTSPSTPIDTITCANDSILLHCTVTAPFASNATAEWLDSSSLPTGSDSLQVTQADANGADFQIFTFRTTNNANGCTQDFDVLVWFNLNVPLVSQLADQTINCSQSEILLTHPLNGSSNVMEGWLDGTGTQTALDTITASTTGDYYYQVQSTLNGCTNTDTVFVAPSLDLWLDMPTDTLICPQQIVTITPLVLGNAETPSFTWSTGATTMSETATGGVDSLLIVSVSTPSGCMGTDTTLVLITEPATISVTPFLACNDGSLQVTNVMGGAGNNQYSLDGTTWTDSTNFSGLSFGAYSVYVQDGLGCVYDTTALLDGNAISVAMSFVASTYNAEGDTIVLVNTTSFTGLDSVAWNLPPLADVVYLSDSVVILSMATSGWYDIELIGYLDANCEFSYVNPVFFGDHAPFFDDSTQINGIVDFQVYPNPLNLSVSNAITVDIEFGKSQNYTILVTNALGQPIPSMSVSSMGETVSHQLTFPSGTAAGTYRVHIISDYDAKQVQITLF